MNRSRELDVRYNRSQSIVMNAAIALPGTAAGGLATASWLENNLHADWLRIVDVRSDPPPASSRARDEAHDLPRFIELGPRAGWLRAGRSPAHVHPPATFVRSHIPGSTSLDVGGRLFDDAGALVCAPELAMAMSETGVGDEHIVVLVDDGIPGPAMVAAWALRHYGHLETLVLAGGFSRWTAEGRPVTRKIVRHGSASFTARKPS